MRDVIGNALLGLAALAFGSTVGTGAAHADEPLRELDLAVTAGGGIEDFARAGMRHTTGPTAIWDARVAIGTRNPVSGELAYIGSIARIDALIGLQEGTLVGHGAEALIRSSFRAEGPWQPYAFLGVGWRHYSVTGADFRMEDTGMNDSDNVLEFPMGVGASFRYRGLVVDARATFRAVVEEDLVLADENADEATMFAGMHTGGISARVGYVF